MDLGGKASTCQGPEAGTWCARETAGVGGTGLEVRGGGVDSGRSEVRDEARS